MNARQQGGPLYFVHHCSKDNITHKATAYNKNKISRKSSTVTVLWQLSGNLAGNVLFRLCRASVLCLKKKQHRLNVFDVLYLFKGFNWICWVLHPLCDLFQKLRRKMKHCVILRQPVLWMPFGITSNYQWSGLSESRQNCFTYYWSRRLMDVSHDASEKSHPPGYCEAGAPFRHPQLPTGEALKSNRVWFLKFSL